VHVLGPEGNGASFDQRPGETADTLKDGWFYSGDLGCFDKDGFLYITGRKKEVIVLGTGKNIYPEEVEARYLKSPLIKEFCVIQGGDSTGGLCAVVVPDRVAASGAASLRDRIRDELSIIGAVLPSYMRITDLVLVDAELPKTRLGKLRRKQVEALAKEAKAGGKEGSKEGDAPLSDHDREVLEHPAAAVFLERLRGITREQIRDAARKYMPVTDYARIAFVPGKKK